MKCENGSCKLSEKIWAITDTKKLYRLTFSKNLADYICKSSKKLSVTRVNFVIGKQLKIEEQSKTGLYAIMSKSKDIALRITMFKELAAIMAEDNSRYICEAFLKGESK